MDNLKFFQRFFGHLHIINRHRRIVRNLCFKLWLYRQWLTHDLSKYSPAEFFVWVKYFQWFRSPNMFEREKKWYSSSWLHHKWRNKHHYEYWNDKYDWKYLPVKMPMRYLKESFCDRISATKIYKWNGFKDNIPYDYFNTKSDFSRIHKDTIKVLNSRLEMYKDKWEKETFDYIKKNYKNSMWQNY